MSWQLANEPRPGSDANATPHFEVFVKWIDETAGFIKTLAPKQLVSTGNEGWMGTAGSRELFVKSHATKNVDYLTFHMWAPNWSWFDPKKAAATYDGAWTKMQDYLDWHIDAANKMAKPIVLEEFGINRDDGSFRPIATTVYRDKFYTAIYGLLARRAAAGDAIAGSNFWAWGGVGPHAERGFHVEGGRRFRRRSAAGTAGPLLRVRLGRLDHQHHLGARAADEWVCRLGARPAVDHRAQRRSARTAWRDSRPCPRPRRLRDRRASHCR